MANGGSRTKGVAVFTDGILADGQHRLHAIIKADLPVKMLLVTGLHPDSADGIDQHRARKISDVAKIVGKDWLNSAGVAIVRLMYGMEAATAADVLGVAEKRFSKRYLRKTICRKAPRA